MSITEPVYGLPAPTQQQFAKPAYIQTSCGSQAADQVQYGRYVQPGCCQSCDYGNLTGGGQTFFWIGLLFGGGMGIAAPWFSCFQKERFEPCGRRR